VTHYRVSSKRILRIKKLTVLRIWKRNSSITSGGNYGRYQVVGNGKVTNPETCGKFKGFRICANVHLHDIITLQGKNYKGKVHYRKMFMTCNRPDCPICFRRHWAVREAKNIDARIKEGSKTRGLGEHIIDSIPPNDWGLPFEKMKAKALKVLKTLGVSGGCVIFRAFRYNNWEEARHKRQAQGFYYSPHFHVIGFIDGGYGKCRGCKNMRANGRAKCLEKCMGCDGFEGRSRRLFYKAGGNGFGHIVKVKGKRRSVFGTAWYQLEHSTLVDGGKRNHVVTWFGTCSYRKLKLKREDRVGHKCPICGYDLKRGRYVGSRLDEILADWWSETGEDDFLDERGVPQWILVDGG
jgi:hypothetical protein